MRTIFRFAVVENNEGDHLLLSSLTKTSKPYFVTRDPCVKRPWKWHSAQSIFSRGPPQGVTRIFRGSRAGGCLSLFVKTLINLPREISIPLSVCSDFKITPKTTTQFPVGWRGLGVKPTHVSCLLGPRGASLTRLSCGRSLPGRPLP